MLVLDVVLGVVVVDVVFLGVAVPVVGELEISTSVSCSCALACVTSGHLDHNPPDDGASVGTVGAGVRSGEVVVESLVFDALGPLSNFEYVPLVRHEPGKSILTRNAISSNSI